MPGRRRWWESRPGNVPAGANAFEQRSSFESADVYLYGLRTRQSCETPEGQLLTTVLCDALRILTAHYDYRHQPAGIGKIWRETWDWFWSDDECGWVLGAAQVCAHLSVDLGRTRAVLIDWIESKNATTSSTSARLGLVSPTGATRF
jgi:hypothetical protein